MKTQNTKTYLGEFFSDYDTTSGSFCVFYTDDDNNLKSGFAYASFCSEETAKNYAIEKNQQIK